MRHPGTSEQKARWLAKNEGWLANARENWRPRKVKPFTVRVWLSSPVAWGADGVKLDGYLQRLVVERETGYTADDVFAECPLGVDVDIPIPVADTVLAGMPIAKASWGIPPPIACEGIRWRRKRARPEVMSGDRLLIAGGAFKSHNIPVQTLVTPWLDFHLEGDQDAVRDLMGDAIAIGRGYSSGLGSILGVEYQPDPSRRSLVWQRKPMRVLPLEGLELESPIVDERSTRAPYWKGRGTVLCAVPVIALGEL